MNDKHKNFPLPLRTVLATTLTVAALTTATFCLNQETAPTAAVTYSPYCVSATCRAAADREAEATANAESLRSQATSLDAEIAALKSEIGAIEAEIATNQAIVDDLASQVVATTAKLEQQQAALAKLLVANHISKSTAVTTTAISALAGSESIGEFVEKKSRQDTAEDQITSSVETINATKADLEKQKIAAEAILEQQIIKRNEAAYKRNQITSLQTTYANNAAAYAADAEEAKKVKEQEIAAEIARYNSDGNRFAGSYNSYPYQDRCPESNLAFVAYGGLVCQCTSYAGWKVKEAYGINIGSWGNAYSWGNSARAYGYTVNGTPAPGTVAVSTAGAWGHVMWVESVNADGTVNLTEYNNYYATYLVTGSSHVADFGARSNVWAGQYEYIHF